MYNLINFNASLAEQGSYCSFDITTASEEDKKAFFNIITGETLSLKEHVNEVLEVENIYAEECTISTDAGEEPATRIVFITADKKGYATCSVGVKSCVAKIFALFGTPDNWTAPIKVIPRLKTRDKRQVLVIDLG